MDMNELFAKRQNLVVQKMKLDKFFSMFLEKYERKMDTDKPDTPIWKLYKQKFKEYDDIEYNIRTTDYYIAKYKNV